MMQLRPVSFGKVAWSCNDALKIRISITDVQDSHWYQILDGKNIVGVAGLVKFRPSCWKLKAIYLIPSHWTLEHRQDVLDQMIALAKTAGIRRLETITYEPDFFLRMGWQQESVDFLERFKLSIRI